MPAVRTSYPNSGCRSRTAIRRSYARITRLRPGAVRATAPPRRIRCSGRSSPLFTSVTTVESATKGRISSARSSASDGRPKRGWCNRPTCGSRPAASVATVTSLSRSAYVNESAALIGSRGGRRLRPSSSNSPARGPLSIALKAPKYIRAPVPSIPNSDGTPLAAATSPTNLSSASTAPRADCPASRLKSVRWLRSLPSMKLRATTTARAGSSAIRIWAIRRATHDPPWGIVYPLNQPAELNHRIGVSLSRHSRSAAAVSVALPNTATWATSRMRRDACSSPSTSRISRPRRLRTTAVGPAT